MNMISFQDGTRYTGKKKDYYEYGPQIDNGVAGDNWEELYNNYMAARKDAGIEELVTEFQNQLNAYIEANNITSW